MTEELSKLFKNPESEIQIMQPDGKTLVVTKSPDGIRAAIKSGDNMSPAPDGDYHFGTTGRLSIADGIVKKGNNIDPLALKIGWKEFTEIEL